MTDDNLLCFAMWCRNNDEKFVYNPEVLRRVYRAYDLDPGVESLETP